MKRLANTKKGRLAILLALVGAVLTVVLLVTPVLAANFSDVYSDTYDNPDYPAAVSALSGLGVIGGFDDGTFKPHDPVTRQQFAKMIVKLLGYPVTGAEVCPFVDVLVGTSATDPFYPDKYVAVCAANGVTQGIDGTHFAPYNNITRAQVVSMVIRAAQHSGIALENPSAAYYAGTMQGSNFRNLSDPKHGVNVQIAEFNGLFWGIWPDQGSDWNIYGKAARGEVAQILWRLKQKMGGSQTTSTTRPVTTTTRIRSPLPPRPGHHYHYDPVRSRPRGLRRLLRFLERQLAEPVGLGGLVLLPLRERRLRHRAPARRQPTGCSAPTTTSTSAPAGSRPI